VFSEGVGVGAVGVAGEVDGEFGRFAAQGPAGQDDVLNLRRADDPQ
jgi:hypothetical protein